MDHRDGENPPLQSVSIVGFTKLYLFRLYLMVILVMAFKVKVMFKGGHEQLKEC